MHFIAYISGGGVLQWLSIPMMLLFSLAVQVALLAVVCVLAVFVGRWFLDFATRMGLAASLGRFGAAVSEGYREQKQ